MKLLPLSALAFLLTPGAVPVLSQAPKGQAPNGQAPNGQSPNGGARSAPPAASPTAAVKSAAAPLDRVVILGASVSAGFQDFEGSMHPLSAPWNAIVAKTGRSAASFADAMFFLEPAGTGSRQVRSALAKDPTLVLAADFLFWYGYGEFKNDDDRQARLRQGLDELAKFGCPVVAGDLPDVSPGIGKMIRASQVPSKDSLQKLNETVAGWAAARKNVTLVPLSGFLPKLYKGEPLEARGNRWAEGESKRLLHSDLLHLTEEGTAALAVLLADAVCKGCPDVQSDALTFDLRSIVKSKAASRPGSRPAPGAATPPASRPAK